MATIYIDEKAGSDVTGQGAPDQPYGTLAFALFNHQAASAQYLIRKDPACTYEEPTQSALKKAKKGADGLEKKRKKAEEAAAKEAQADSEERERREKLLAESKKIVLKEDETLPRATRVLSFISDQCSNSCLSFTAGETCPLERFAIETCPRLWLGTSFPSTEGYHICGLEGWHRVSPSRLIRPSCTF